MDGSFRIDVGMGATEHLTKEGAFGCWREERKFQTVRIRTVHGGWSWGLTPQKERRMLQSRPGLTERRGRWVAGPSFANTRLVSCLC